MSFGSRVRDAAPAAAAHLLGIDERACRAPRQPVPLAGPAQGFDSDAPDVEVGSRTQFDGSGPGPAGIAGSAARVPQGCQGVDPRIEVVAVGENPGFAQGLDEPAGGMGDDSTDDYRRAKYPFSITVLRTSLIAALLRRAVQVAAALPSSLRQCASGARRSTGIPGGFVVVVQLGGVRVMALFQMGVLTGGRTARRCLVTLTCQTARSSSVPVSARRLRTACGAGCRPRSVNPNTPTVREAVKPPRAPSATSASEILSSRVASRSAAGRRGRRMRRPGAGTGGQ